MVLESLASLFSAWSVHRKVLPHVQVKLSMHHFVPLLALLSRAWSLLLPLPADRDRDEGPSQTSLFEAEQFQLFQPSKSVIWLQEQEIWGKIITLGAACADYFHNQAWCVISLQQLVKNVGILKCCIKISVTGFATRFSPWLCKAAVLTHRRNV